MVGTSATRSKSSSTFRHSSTENQYHYRIHRGRRQEFYSGLPFPVLFSSSRLGASIRWTVPKCWFGGGNRSTTVARGCCCHRHHQWQEERTRGEGRFGWRKGLDRARIRRTKGKLLQYNDGVRSLLCLVLLCTYRIVEKGSLSFDTPIELYCCRCAQQAAYIQQYVEQGQFVLQSLVVFFFAGAGVSFPFLSPSDDQHCLLVLLHYCCCTIV